MARGDHEGGPRRRPASGAGSRSAASKTETRPPTRAEAPPPLARFAPERLAGFLELALSPAELLRLGRKLGVNSPGYRLEKLSPPDLAALLAKEYADEPRSQPLLEDAIGAALKSPALRTMWLTPAAARELAQLVAGDPVHAAARLAWRYIGDGDPAVRAAAERAIDAGAALLEQLDDDVQRSSRSPANQDSSADAETERRLARAEREKEAARALLHQARVEVAERDRRLSELKGEVGALRLETARQSAELSRLHASRSTDERKGAHEVRRLAAEKGHLEGRVHDLEERLAQERHRADHLAQQLAQERERAPILQQHPPGEEPVGEAGDFAVPHFTAEFYASIERWDRRLVKTAFEKALLLARDRRHPSLRALPLEGIDNYFRIRVATDVRLIYRRGAEGRLEILSLIDREDLERYVKQAKTRRES